MATHAPTLQNTRWANYSNDWPDGHRKCLKCNEIKPNSAFHKHSRCKGGYNSVCKSCRIPTSQKQYQTIAKERLLFDRAKSRAKRLNREFSIDLEDVVIPDICPVFGVPMESPSLDRIDSSKGYVKGNVRVISLRANTLKNDATIQELEMVLADLKRLQQVGACEITFG